MMKFFSSKFSELYWVNILFLAITPLVSAIFVPLYLMRHGFSWPLFTLFLVYGAVTGLMITAGYHRFFAHRSYAVKPGLQLVYILFGAAAFQGSVLQWSSDHRRHHREVDTEDDPHNIKQGFFYAHMGWLFFKENPKFAGKYPPDLATDPMVAWQHRYYAPIALAMGFGFPTLVGWALGDALGGLLFGGFLRVVFTNHSTFLINSLAHTWGRRPYSDQTARDSLLLAFLAYGEGYHNFHHSFATDYRNGIRWYQWDPTKWLIRFLSFFGITYRLRSVPSTMILNARLSIEQKRLEGRGVPEGTLTPFKQKVEEAQRRLRALGEEYARLKANMKDESHRRLDHMRAEIKTAKREFKLAWASWRAAQRGALRVRAIS